MRKLFLLITLVILVIIVGCERFEHKFEPVVVEENYISDFFNTFADSISTFPENISNIMGFYHDDYNNNGTTKTDVENFYNGFTLINTPISLQATLVDTLENNQIQWRLLATELSGAVYMDSVFTDVLLPTDDSFIFYGNQADMRNVVVELFTGQWCQNCPKAEEALHNLRQVYGSRFSYVEYHWNDDLETDFAFDLFQYYPNAAGFPFGVINGNAGFIYTTPSVEEVQAAVEAMISPLLQQDPPALLENVQASLAENTISGSIDITLNNISTENLALVLVLMEDYNADYLNHHGEPHHNIALKRETIDLSSVDITLPVTFSMADLNVLPAWYNGILPEDISLVLWVQTLETSYNEVTCAVHNVVEIEIER